MSSDTSTRNAPATRIYGLIARAARVGVLFRRGPSKQVLLVYWDMERDLFYPGQWLNGRIYERRSDLSPSGKRLVYLAASHKPPYHTWTAVSRPPYLTAVVFWPNMGTWGGGGLFEKENRLSLNHNSSYLKPTKGARVPQELSVAQVGDCPVGGEDARILDCRLRRDGWRLIQEGVVTRHDYGAFLWIEYDPPTVWAHPRPGGSGPWELRMIERGIKERNGTWNVVEYALRNGETEQEAPLGRLDWADWCHSGDLVFTRDGCVWRMAVDETDCFPPHERRLVDLRPLTFRELAPPQPYDWAVDVPLPPPYRAD